MLLGVGGAQSLHQIIVRLFLPYVSCGVRRNVSKLAFGDRATAGGFRKEK